jgi:hypothetical protein
MQRKARTLDMKNKMKNALDAQKLEKQRRKEIEKIENNE